MKCIEIHSVPLGEAPEVVRKAWVGLRLPTVITSRGSLVEEAGGVLAQAESVGGYVVPSLESIEILRLYAAEAAAWWDQHAPKFLHPMARFTFDTGCCRLVDSLPSITRSARGEHDTVKRFLEEYNEEALKKANWSLLSASHLQRSLGMSAGEWTELASSGITVPTVQLFAHIVSHDYWMQIESAMSEIEYQNLLQEGHAVFASLHEVARRYGVSCSFSKIDRPLSWVDAAHMDGTIEIVDGGVKLTPEGEEIARKIDDES